MSEICGIIDFKDHAPRESEIRGMMRVIKHRGPDNEGAFHEDGVHLGIVSLTDAGMVTSKQQPLRSKDDRHVLILDGRLYNKRELREELESKGQQFNNDDDDEVLLAAYKEWGEECLQRFNGDWAFVLYDRKEKSLICVRDRFGIRPLYYYLDEYSFAFASEIAPLLPLLPGKPEVNETAVYDFLVFNRTDHNEETFFKRVKRLRHGHLIKIRLGGKRENQGEVGFKKWYDLRSNLKEPFQSPEEFRETLSSAIGLRLRGDVPGVCLSGGLDSSSIAAIMLKDHGVRGVPTFSAVYGWGVEGDESGYIDLFRNEPLKMYFATPTAESLCEDLVPFVRAIGEPIPSTSPYAQYKVMELAKGKVKAIMDGQGADEQLAGYHYFFGFFFKGLLRRGRLYKFVSESASYLGKHRSFIGLESFAYFLLPDYFRVMIRGKKIAYLNADFARCAGKESKFSKNLYSSPNLREALLNHFEYKLEHLNKWGDRNSKACSIELRSPFLDHRLVERMLSLTEDNFIRKGINKHILREAMKGTLNEKIRCRLDKIGFDTPMNKWFHQIELKQFTKDIMVSVKKRTIFDSKKVDLILSQHWASQSDHSKEIWKMINYELWHREFLGN